MKAALKLFKKAVLLAFVPVSIMVILYLSQYYNSSRPELPDERFFTSFEHIKTDQFVWNAGSGHGGIYWVGENELVLDAVIKGDRGLYEVNVVDGSAIKLIDGPGHGYRYCFTEGSLYVSVQPPHKLLPVLHQPRRYQLISKIVPRGLPDGWVNAGVRCGLFEVPKGEGITGSYQALNEKDGLVNVVYSELRKQSSMYLSDNNGKRLKIISTDAKELKSFQGRAKYYSYEDAYFGYFSDAPDCRGATTWRLYRKDWRLETGKVCYGEWDKGTSILLSPTKVGLFAEQHSISRSRFAKSFLITEEQEIPVDMVSSIGSVTGPDGCRVAYGSGEIGYGEKRFSQHLKIFQACDYMQTNK